MKAELRAIEFELDQLRKHGLPAKNPEAYAAVSASFRRLWSATRLIDRMRRSLANETSTTETELRIDQALARFVSSRRVPFRQIFSNLTMASPSFRHALRVTIAVAVGFWLGRLLPLTNAYWIVMTVIIILKPGYSLTKQRNGQRIVGTAIGCAASIALMMFVKEPHILLVVMFASMVMSYSLLLFNYAASVVFTSSYVLLMFHLLAPGSMRIIGERAIDTVVGCAIAIAASHLFPYWEYRLMGKLVNNMIAATRQYLEASWWWSGKPALAVAPAAVTEAGARAPRAAVAREDVPAGVAGGRTPGPATEAKGATEATAKDATESNGGEADAALDAKRVDPQDQIDRKDELTATLAAATANAIPADDVPPPASTSASGSASAPASNTRGAAPASGTSAAAGALDRDYRYRLARKNVHVAFANLGQAFQRMMLEPKSAQKFVPELNNLLVRSHVLASEIAAAAPLLRTIIQVDRKSQQPLQRALSVVRENLEQAEAGNATPADQPDVVKQLTRELDSMVIEAEKAPDSAGKPEAVSELKLLAHQCKQMLAASFLIRKDASVIRLPEN
jgi:uncharacterized membrane protein YccC